jgi:hypothetical protein
VKNIITIETLVFLLTYLNAKESGSWKSSVGEKSLRRDSPRNQLPYLLPTSYLDFQSEEIEIEGVLRERS